AARRPEPLSEAAERERHRQECERFKAWGMMGRYVDADLERIDPRVPADLGRLATRLMRLVDDPQLVAVGGPRGRGKTWLAHGVCRYFYRRGFFFRYALTPSFLEELDRDRERRQRHLEN